MEGKSFTSDCLTVFNPTGFLLRFWPLKQNLQNGMDKNPASAPNQHFYTPCISLERTHTTLTVTLFVFSICLSQSGSILPACDEKPWQAVPLLLTNKNVLNQLY